ncbi:MAG TPA: T9SS type A sorting domain-containing protein [Flavobacteriales bacterium]|nr:T9SS type A sorting domain-containing protein [Flavobacteriales bacterium]
MKTILTIFVTLSFALSFAQTTAIPDYYFEYRLIKLGLDTGAVDGSVPTANIDTVTSLDLAMVQVGHIYNLTGIEDFTALVYLKCSSNKITSLDLSNNTKLENLICYSNQLTSLDISQNIHLKYLNCYSNQLTNLDVSNKTALESLMCSGNPLISLDLSQNTALTFLHCGSCPLISLDVSNNTFLEALQCYNTQLTSLDVSQNVSLIDLDCSYNQLSSIDLSNNHALAVLRISMNPLTSLDLSQNSITYLDCRNTLLNCLNLNNGNNINMWGFYLSENPDLTCVEVDDPNLEMFSFSNFSFWFDPQTSFSTNCGNDCDGTELGIFENAEQTIQAYPNPFSSSTTIEFPNYDNEPITLSIYDMLGNMARKVENIHSDKVLVERGSLTKGIYFVELRSADKMYLSKLVIE